jgi:vacuolar-type H+-ATPase subunit I/STV1
MNSPSKVLLAVAFIISLLLTPHSHGQAKAPVAQCSKLQSANAANRNSMTVVDALATSALQQAIDETSLADEDAAEATAKSMKASNDAHKAAMQLQALESTVSRVDQYKEATQIEIRYKMGQLELSGDAKNALDEIAGTVKGQRGYVIDVQSFSASKSPFLISNSKRMAEAIVRYLITNHSIPLFRISVIYLQDAQLAAKGSFAKKKNSGGRIVITVMRNYL